MSETDEWDSYAAGWDHDEAAQAYAAAAFESLEMVLAGGGMSLDGVSVIDFGCGTGLLTERLASRGATVLGVDTSNSMLDVLQAKIDEHGWVGLQTSSVLPSTADHDLIVCSSVCSFVNDYPATVLQLVSLLRPGGLFVQWDWERESDDPDGHGLTRTEITGALTAAGLDGVVVDTAFTAAVGDETMCPLMGHGRRPTA